MIMFRNNKKGILKKNLFVLLFSFFVLFGAMAGSVYAVVGAMPSDDGSPGQVGAIPEDEPAQNRDVDINVRINNPLSDDLKDIPSFIEALLNIVLIIGVPIVALAIIYSGFLFIQAQGNVEKLKTAKAAITYTLIGAALLLGSFVLARAIKGTVDEIRSNAMNGDIIRTIV
jgi:hypothetical protein